MNARLSKARDDVDVVADKSSCIIALLCAMALISFGGASAASDGLPDTIERVKPAIVAVGTFLPTRRPPAVFRGTGFVVGNGRLILTNSHVVPKKGGLQDKEHLAIYSGTGRKVTRRAVRLLARDDAHDLAVLAFNGPSITALRLGDSRTVREGQRVAFTGFPIGMVLGIHPATHTGIVSAISPVALPQIRSKDLSVRMIKALRDPYDVFQLDATAYPGNSGSPVYRAQDGVVIGVINKVFVKSTKENVLKDPSGITYAIPIRYGRALIDKAKR